MQIIDAPQTPPAFRATSSGSMFNVSYVGQVRRVIVFSFSHTDNYISRSSRQLWEKKITLQSNMYKLTFIKNTKQAK